MNIPYTLHSTQTNNRLGLPECLDYTLLIPNQASYRLCESQNRFSFHLSPRINPHPTRSSPLPVIDEHHGPAAPQRLVVVPVTILDQEVEHRGVHQVQHAARLQQGADLTAEVSVLLPSVMYEAGEGTVSLKWSHVRYMR